MSDAARSPEVDGLVPLPGMVIVENSAFEDERGWFVESWNARRHGQAGISCEFVQDNVSWSRHGVLRGLHMQRAPHAQAKLVSVLEGAVFDVGVDVRPGSETFGQWFGCMLSAENRRQLFIPEGFAHGFIVLSDAALLSYKCSAYYHPASEVTIRWDDPLIGIDWPMRPLAVSVKDEAGVGLSEVAGSS